MRVAWLIGALLATTVAASAQGISPTLYFGSAAEELESRKALHARVEALEKEIAAAGVESLPKLLAAAEELLTALQRHAAYLRVQSLEDTSDQTAKAAGEAVGTDWSVLNAALRSRLARLAPGDIPALGRYARLAVLAQRDAAESFSPDAARYRGSVTLPVQASIAEAYGRLVGTLDNADYNAAAPAAAALLATLVDLQNRDAEAQSYVNAADRKYRSLQLSDALIERTLAAVKAEAPAYRQYQQVLAEHAARRAAGTPRPAIPLAQGRQLIRDALAPLGGEYAGRFAALLDPANGRLDLTGGSHRARTGASIAVYDAPVALFLTGYDGSLASVSKIAHEGGHAIHRELMNAGGAPIYERAGPNYVFEGFAIFNELLLLDQAARIAKTSAERTAALEWLLSKLTLELFVSAEETDFERRLYTAASGHALLDRAAIDASYRESIAPYEQGPMAEAGGSRGWMRKSLLWEDPLYLVNYLYAQVVAVGLWDRLQTDRDFAPRYEALLRRGFDADAEALLGSLGIRLDDARMIGAAARLIRSKTDELRELYRAE